MVPHLPLVCPGCHRCDEFRLTVVYGQDQNEHGQDEWLDCLCIQCGWRGPVKGLEALDRQEARIKVIVQSQRAALVHKIRSLKSMGLTGHEIAKRLGISMDAVYQSLANDRARLVGGADISS